MTDTDEVVFLQLLAMSSNPGTRAAAVEALDGMALKWVYNPDQQRGFGGRFGSGTGTAQQQQQPKVKPTNPAAMPRKAVNPAMPAPPPVLVPPPKPVGKPGGKVPPKKAPPHPGLPPQQGPPAKAPPPRMAPRGETLTLTHRATQETRTRDARTRSVDRVNRAIAAADLKAAKTRLAELKRIKTPTKAERDAAVKAMRKNNGIPSKFPKGTSAARRHAAAVMASATRALVGYNAARAAETAQAKALQDDIKNSKQPATQAWAKAQLAATNAKLAATNAKIKSASAAYASARKTWRS